MTTRKTSGAKKKTTKKASTPRKTAARKASASRKAARKATPGGNVRKPVAKKKVAAKAAAGKGAAPGRRRPQKSARRPSGQSVRKREMEAFGARLLSMREQVTEQIASLKESSLRREDSVYSSEDGTDAFDRQFALTLAGSEHESLVDIDDALARIEEGTYGICEECDEAIERPRLEALPFVRMCIKCQSEKEKLARRFRPATVL